MIWGRNMVNVNIIVTEKLTIQKESDENLKETAKRYLDKVHEWNEEKQVITIQDKHGKVHVLPPAVISTMRVELTEREDEKDNTRSSDKKA